MSSITENIIGTCVFTCSTCMFQMIKVTALWTRVCVRVCMRPIVDTELMVCLTVTCQLTQTTVLFGRGSSAPRGALEGGWEQFITHAGWG